MKHWLIFLKDNSSDNSFRIPIVNFSKFKFAKNDTEKQQTADEVVTAFKEVGFVYLSEHGISQSVVQNVFQEVHLAIYAPSGPYFWNRVKSSLIYLSKSRYAP